MALSGTLNSSDYKGRYLQLTWSATQDVTNNKSTISWTLKSVGKSEWSMYKAGNFKVVIDGATVYSTESSNRITIEDGTVIATGTKVLAHNGDGTRTFTASIAGGIYYYDVNCTGSATFTLNTIPRVSSFSVSNANPYMGNSVTFTISRNHSNFTHTLLLTWGGTTSTIAAGVGTSYTWPIPLDLANNLPSSTYSGCYITCITYNGSTEIGRKQISMTLYVPTSVVPSISSVTISEAETWLATKFGAYIQGHSKLKVVTAAAGAYSSTIKSYSITILGKTYSGSTITSGTITSSGSVSIAVTVTDSRGRTASTTRTVTVTAYAAPKITLFSAERCDSDGTLNDEGECVKVSYAFTITSLSSKNTNIYEISYKTKETSEYTNLVASTGYSQNTTYLTSAIFDGNTPYDVILTVRDSFTAVSQIADIPTAFTLVDYHASGTGVAFGKVAEEEDTFENALDLHQIGNSYAFQPSSFEGAKGYTLLAVIKLTALNVNAPIVFVINRRGALCPMTVYVRFASSSSTMDPDLGSITYEGDNYGAFLVKSAASTWKLYVDNTAGWSNPCLQHWATSDNQNARLTVTFPSEQVAGTDPSVLGTFYRATPANMRSLLDFIYPVGSIYWSYSQVSPASFLGGTWARLQNAFLWASDANATIGATGGEQTHTLLKAEIPPHGHLVAVTGGSTNYGTTRTAIASFSKVTAGYQDSSTVLEVGSGDGKAHNNMPPYIQVSAWRRTA